jgi:hypothetical protein
MEREIMMKNLGIRAAAMLFLTVAAGSAGACGGTVSVGGSTGTGSVGSAGNGGETGTGTGTALPGCPASEPQNGDACASQGLTCNYPTAGCGVGVEASCFDGIWSLAGPATCACPAQLPAGGSPCDPCCTNTCSYAMGSTCGPSAMCDPSGTWTVTVPPCPPPSCGQLTQPLDCAMMDGCRWLVPGCSSPPPSFYEGCYPADCDPNGGGCPMATCIQVDTDPCWNSGCTACSGGTAYVCTLSE